ncbi:MAG: hypothetical protein ACTSSK_06265, partial [Candidatus Heimdallarchaeota archaeon]
VYSSAVSDTTAPTINSITPTNSEVYGPYGVNFDVVSTDSYGIEEVKFYYRVNYGGWNSYSMYKGSFDHYLAAIGNFNEGDFIQYYVTSEDSSSNHNIRTSDNSGLYYSFTVLHNDLTGPTITNVHHIPVAPNETEVVDFNCTITDPNGIQYATLHYRINSGGWLGHSLALDVNDNYIATRGPFTVGDFVEYYISAADDSTQGNIGTNDNSGMYYSFNVTSADGTPPEITNIGHSPTTPNDEDPVVFHCDVTDASGVYSVNLYCRFNGGSWSQILLMPSTGDTYSGGLGGLDYLDFVEYYVNATDDSLNQNFIVDDNSGLYYSFVVVTTDSTPPEINLVQHDPIIPTELSSVNISCYAWDVNGIANVTLHYQVDYGTWTEVDMTITTINVYLVTLGSFAVGERIDYYITAFDNIGNEATNDNNGQNYYFLVDSSTTTTPVPVVYFIPFVIMISFIVIFRKRK